MQRNQRGSNKYALMLDKIPSQTLLDNNLVRSIKHKTKVFHQPSKQSFRINSIKGVTMYMVCQRKDSGCTAKLQIKIASEFVPAMIIFPDDFLWAHNHLPSSVAKTITAKD